MLASLNKAASELKLTHSKYRVMATLISFFNVKAGMAYPTIDVLSKYCQMPAYRISRCLKALNQKGLLLIIREVGKSKKYHFTRIITDIDPMPERTTNRYRKKTDKETSLTSSFSNDVLLKISSEKDKFLERTKLDPKLKRLKSRFLIKSKLKNLFFVSFYLTIIFQLCFEIRNFWKFSGNSCKIINRSFLQAAITLATRKHLKKIAGYLYKWRN